MIVLEDPPGFVVRTELQKAAFENGFRLERGHRSGWLRFGSTTAHGDIWIAGASMSGPWLLSVEHPEMGAEMGLSSSLEVVGPGASTFVFNNLHDFYTGLDRSYRLGVSLPDAPLQRFRARVEGISTATEAERLIVQRIGQGIFREALLKYWNGCCRLTGIADVALLRASHIVPWAECETDSLRLDVHNGLLLSALWDAAFDSGMISFANNGEVLVSQTLSPNAVAALGLPTVKPLTGLTDAHCANLARHRAKYGYSTR
jgi:hypothetical protein